jgi:hypothetical protein
MPARPRPAARRLCIAALLSALAASGARAQDPAAAAPPTRELRVFLDCPQDGCDFDYFRTETPWVAHVRDRTVADVHVLLTRLGTGAGGEEYTIVLIGQGRFAAERDTLRVTTPPNQPSDLNRQAVTRAVQLALAPFVARTPGGARLRIVADDEGGGRSGVPADDPWNAWVFEVGAGGNFEDEERQRDLELDGYVNARRITEAWKIGISGDFEVETSEFELDDRTVTNRRDSYSGGAVAVKSLGEHWGAGGQLSVSSSTFDNTELLVRAAPAIEYSVFPYSEATRQQLVFQYSVGVSSYRYREETIFDRLEETRPTQAFVVGYDVQQPWGSADAELEAANFLDDFEKFRLEVDASVDLRLFRGLELELGGSASLIRDQISIVKRDATPEEILLQRRALLTDYRYSAFVGLSYTFGSIFNSVVNPRFGTGPGDILR